MLMDRPIRRNCTILFSPLNVTTPTALLAKLRDSNIDLHLVDMRHTKPSAELQPRATLTGKFEFLIAVSRNDADAVRRLIGPHCGLFEALDETGTVVLSSSVPWFPRTLRDLDESSKLVFEMGVELNADHPGFSDAAYRVRRSQIAELTAEHRMGEPLVRIEYTAEEVRTWNACYAGLLELYPSHACARYNEIRRDMFKKCGYRLDNVPQLEDVSNYVQGKCPAAPAHNPINVDLFNF